MNPWVALWGVRTLLLVSFLAPVCVTDVRRRTIGNGWCLALAGSGLALMTTEAVLKRPFFAPVLLAAGGGLLSALLLGSLCRLIAKDGFGFGDVKLIAALGLFLGLTSFLRAMVLTGVLTLAAALWMLAVHHAKKTDTLPLAPFLVTGALLSQLLELRSLL